MFPSAPDWYYELGRFMSGYFFEGSVTLTDHDDNEVTLPYMRVTGDEGGQWHGEAKVVAMPIKLQRMLGGEVEMRTAEQTGGTAHATGHVEGSIWTVSLEGVPVDDQ